MKSSKWLNSAKRRRIQAKFRRHLCRILQCPVDSCFTTSELLRDARAERKSQGSRLNLGWRGQHAVAA